MKLSKTRKKRISEECWALDYHIVKWLNEHLKVYLKDKNYFSDMTVNKFNYHGRVYTELELVKELLYTTKMLLIYYDGDLGYDLHEMKRLKDEMYDILKILHFYLGW